MRERRRQNEATSGSSSAEGGAVGGAGAAGGGVSTAESGGGASAASGHTSQSQSGSDQQNRNPNGRLCRCSLIPPGSSQLSVTTITCVISFYQAPPFFVCNVEKLGGACVQGYAMCSTYS